MGRTGTALRPGFQCSQDDFTATYKTPTPEPFPWRRFLNWAGWILLLVVPAAVILHHEISTAQKAAPSIEALDRAEAAKARAAQRLEKLLGRPIGGME